MAGDNILYFKQRKCKELEEEKYIAGAINCLEQARRLSPSIKNCPYISQYVKASIRGIFYSMNHTNITLDDIGTSEEELVSLISPPELGFDRFTIENRWRWVMND